MAITTAQATHIDNDGLVHLPDFGAQCVADYSHAIDEAQAVADANGTPCGVWVRDGWSTACEHSPDSITPDPASNGWELVAVVDPTEWGA
jgi:hypothetical protein